MLGTPRGLESGAVAIFVTAEETLQVSPAIFVSLHSSVEPEKSVGSDGGIRGIVMDRVNSSSVHNYSSTGSSRGSS